MVARAYSVRALPCQSERSHPRISSRLRGRPVARNHRNDRRRFISQVGSIDRNTPPYLARRVRCDVIDRSPKGKRYTETEVGASRLDGILTSPPGRWRMLPACHCSAVCFLRYGAVRKRLFVPALNLLGAALCLHRQLTALANRALHVSRVEIVYGTYGRTRRQRQRQRFISESSWGTAAA